MPSGRPARSAAGRRRPDVALTFDDGPGDATEALLAELARGAVPATFFIVGSRIRGREPLIRSIAAGGHELGCHSWSHGRLARRPARAWIELRRTALALRRAGAPSPRLFRPPYLSWSRALGSAVRLAGMRAVGWDVDPRDWEVRDPELIVDRVYSGTHSGSIVVLHDRADCAATRAAVPALIGGLRDRGMRLVTVSELLASTPPSRSGHRPARELEDGP